MRPAGGLEDPALDGRDRPVSRTDLDRPCAHRGWPLPRPSVVGTIATLQDVPHEQFGKSVRPRAVNPVFGRVVSLPMYSRRENYVQPATLRDIGYSFRVPAESDRGQLDESVYTSPSHLRGLGGRFLAVVQLLTAQEWGAHE